MEGGITRWQDLGMHVTVSAMGQKQIRRSESGCLLSNGKPQLWSSVDAAMNLTVIYVRLSSRERKTRKLLLKGLL